MILLETKQECGASTRQISMILEVALTRIYGSFPRKRVVGKMNHLRLPELWASTAQKQKQSVC
jgi:hypothetical protein